MILLDITDGVDAYYVYLGDVQFFLFVAGSVALQRGASANPRTLLLYIPNNEVSVIYATAVLKAVFNLTQYNIKQRLIEILFF